MLEILKHITTISRAFVGLVLVVFTLNWGQSQNTYILLDDAIGIDRARHQTQLDTIAERLANIFPVDSIRDNFKVFDFGFSLAQYADDEGYPEAITRMQTVAEAQAPYYLLFGKESNEIGPYNKFWVHLKLPSETSIPCFTEAKRQTIQDLIEKEVNKVHEANNKIPYLFYEAEIAGMKVLEYFLGQLVNCCPENANARNNQCDYCFYTPEQMTGILGDRGMLAFEGSTISIMESNSFSNINSNYDIVLSDEEHTWYFTQQLEKFVENIAGAQARVLYFDNLTCPDFEAYLEGEFPATSNAFGRNNDTTFFEEIVILNFDDNPQVFFKFSGTDQSNESIIWGLKHLAMGKPGGLIHTAACLEIEQCFGGYGDWLTAWVASNMFTDNWSFIAAAWAADTGEEGTYGAKYPMSKNLKNYLFSDGGRSTLNLGGFETIAEEEGIETQAGKYAEQFKTLFYDLADAYPNAGFNGGVVDFMANCQTIILEDVVIEPVPALARFSPSSTIHCLTPTIKADLEPNSNTFCTPDDKKLVLIEDCEPYKVYGKAHPAENVRGAVFSFWCPKSNKLYKPYYKGIDAQTIDYNQFVGYAPTGTNFEGLKKEEKEALYYQNSETSFYFKQKILIEQDCSFEIIDNTHNPSGKAKDEDCNCQNGCDHPEIQVVLDTLVSEAAKKFLVERCSAIANDVQKRKYAYQIATLIQNLGKHYKDFENGTADPEEYNWSGRWEEYEIYLDALKNHSDGISLLHANLNEAISAGDYYKVYMVLYHANQTFYEDLDIDQRFGAIKTLSLGPMLGNNLWENQEARVLDLIKTISKDPNAINQFLTKLETEDRLMKRLLSKMNNWVGDDNREAFVIELTKLVHDAKRNDTTDVYLVWDLPESRNVENSYELSYEFVGNDIAFTTKFCEFAIPSGPNGNDKTLCLTSKTENWDAINPFSLITFVKIDEVKVLGNAKEALGKWQTFEQVPAIFAAYAIEQTLVEKQFADAMVAIEVGGIFIGATELAIAIKIGSRARMLLAGYILASDVTSFTFKKENVKKYLINDKGFSETDAEKLATYIDNVLAFNALLAGGAGFVDLPSAAKVAASVERTQDLGVDLGKFKAETGTAIGERITGQEINQIGETAKKELLNSPEGRAELEKARAELNSIQRTIDINDLLNRLNSYPLIQKWITDNTLPIETIAKIEDWLNANNTDLLSKLNIDFSEDIASTNPIFFNYLSNNPAQINSYELLTNLPSVTRTSPEILARLADDFTIPGYKSFLEQNPEWRMLIWKKLNSLGLAGINFQLVNWFEELWLKGKMTFTEYEDKLRAFFDGSIIAYIDDTNVQRVDVELDDEVIRAVNSEGTLDVRCNNSACKIGEKSCFIAQTVIHTPYGDKPINKIEKGEIVYSYDFIKQQKVEAQVTNAYRRIAFKLIRIFYNGDTITTTEEHPFYINKKWLTAKEISKGMPIFTENETPILVDSIVSIDSTVTVYNFTVKEFHNYFVGNQRVLVHNSYNFEYSQYFNHVATGFLTRKVSPTTKRGPPQSGFRLKFSIENDGGDIYVVFDPNTLNQSANVNKHLAPQVILDYVITNNGQMMLGEAHTIVSNHAPSVRLAGQVRFDVNGKITYLNNNSGHYPVSVERFLAGEDFWKETGILAEDYDYEAVLDSL